MYNNIQKYIQEYQECQQNKVQHIKKAAPLYLLFMPRTPWEKININVIGPLPRSKDKNTILVIVNQFSKMIRLIVTIILIFLSKVTRIYQDNIWKIHGIPKRIISNRKSQFVFIFMEKLCKALEIKKAMLTVYYSQIDGQTERINQEVKVFLRYYINYKQDDQTKWLAKTEFQYNNKEHVATKHTLFYLNYRKYFQKGNLIVDTKILSLEDLLKQIKKTQKAKISIKKTKKLM